MTPRTIDLGEGAEMVLWDPFLDAGEALSYFDRIRGEIPWKQREIVIAGRRIQEPRLTCWMGDPTAEYTYSGVSNQPVAWSPAVSELRRRVESVTGATYNSVLLNLYRDERDSMGMHRDNEPELGPDPIIASLSLGATRRFQLRHAKKKDAPKHDIDLVGGSLLLMRGSIQRLFRHGVPKETTPRAPRINLTFRAIHVES